jgi:uncharacterized protein (TIRG00374 family)
VNDASDALGDRPPAGRSPIAAGSPEPGPHLTAWVVIKRLLIVAISGISLYLVLPAITEVFASWPQLSSLAPLFFLIALAAELGHFACTFALQRLALRTSAWFSVVTSNLSGNAVTNIVPAGAAMGAAVQFRMLVSSGEDPAVAGAGLTAFSLLSVGALLALPVFVLPAIIFGSPVDKGLAQAAVLGTIGFVLFAGLGVMFLATDRPLRIAGAFVQRVLNATLKRKSPLSGISERLVHERNEIRRVLGRRWYSAVGLTAGRLALDYLCLLACLRATGSHPQPSLVLLAYAVTGVITLIPITPGGLGITEASLSAMLILAGVDPGAAYLATLAYRLCSYWIPLAAGPFAYLAYRWRFGKPEHPETPVPAAP